MLQTTAPKGAGLLPYHTQDFVDAQAWDVEKYMQHENTPNNQDQKPSWFESRNGLILSTIILAAVSLLLLFGNISRIGIWEPWESNEIQVAQQYFSRGESVTDPQDPTQPGYNWAVPTHDGKPIASPLLKTWLMGTSLKSTADTENPEIGKFEFAARFPLAAAAFLMVFAGFFWMRRYFGSRTALLTGISLVTLPAVYLGAQLATSEMLFMVTTSLAIMAFVQILYAKSRTKKHIWGALFGIATALAFLDQRILGLYLILSVIAGFALSQIPYRHAMRLRENLIAASEVGRFEIFLGGSSLLAAVGVVIWGISRSKNALSQAADAATTQLFLPHVAQWVALLVPAFVILAAILIARRTDVIRTLVSSSGAIALAIVAVPALALSIAYGDANPVLLQNGEVIGKLPVLTYLLENHLFVSSDAGQHMYFAMWLRQIGFSMLPWIALVPLALGYLSRATRLNDENGKPIPNLLTPQLAIQRMLLVWSFIALVIIAIASSQGHYYYPAYFPLMAGVGLLLTDGTFWKSARLRPFWLGAMGFVAVATIMMLGKDLERYPTRLIEIFVQLQKDFTLPETFSYGKTLKAIKYASMLVLLAYFGGVVSWAVLTLGDVKSAPGRFKEWRKNRRSSNVPASDAADGTLSNTDVQEVFVISPSSQRTADREAVRNQDGIFGKLARFIEKPAGFSLIITAVFTVFALVVTFDFAPKITHHLSQRGVYQTFVEHTAPGEELVRYQIPASDDSVYLAGRPQIKSSADFLAKAQSPERFFAVMPRNRLAAANSEFRAATTPRQNLAVLDARSSRTILVSNQLKSGEIDHNFVADAIVTDDSKIQRPVTFAQGEKQEHAVFNNQLEFLGYDLDKPLNTDGVATYKWGESMKLTTYFRVLNKVSGDQKLFIHVDFPGNRILADHDPVGGEFPTSQWLPGDIVKDEYDIPIERYSSVGKYSLNFGFFRGDNRMKVEPRTAHDGQNRVTIGHIEVVAF